jgi:hypothetical protein
MMNRMGGIVRAVAMGCLAIPSAVARGQQPGQPPASGASQPQSVQAQANPLQGVPVLRRAREFSLTGAFDYYEPEPGFNRRDRDIGIQALRGAIAAHYESGWEFQFDALAFRAAGTAILSSTPPIPPAVASDALGAGAGVTARWTILDFDRFRFFVDGAGDLILIDRPFPPHGSIYDFFLHPAVGVGARVSDSYWIEAAARFAHISNGQGFDAANPTWDGEGLVLGVRHTLWKQNAHPETTTPADTVATRQQAWITSAEVYWAIPGTDFRITNTIHQLPLLLISHGWPLPAGLEFQVGGLVAYPPQVGQTNEIAGVGPALAWNFVETRQVQLFGDIGADFLQVGSPAYVVPTGGVDWGLLLRGGIGASAHLHGAYWLDASYRRGHLTSGFGPGGGDYARWTGQGVALALRRTFRHSN